MTWVAILLALWLNTIDTNMYSFSYISTLKSGQSLNDFLFHDDTMLNFEAAGQNALHKK
jgi:hypothetical protein